jgi:F-type H+-transporting ATPase subunit delta
MTQSTSRPKTVMDPTAWTLAEVYAQGVMQVCEDIAEAEDVAAELGALLELIDQYPEYRDLLTSSLLSPRDKYAVVSRLVDNHVSPHTDGLVSVLAKHDRLSLLPVVARRFGRLLGRRKGIVDVHVTTAYELSGEEREQLALQLSEALQTQVLLDARTDPDMVGGLIVRVGDKVIDVSIRSQIERLRRRMSLAQGQAPSTE